MKDHPRFLLVKFVKLPGLGNTLAEFSALSTIPSTKSIKKTGILKKPQQRRKK